ncbi:MAG: MvaI/BcnI family restriction endonuclease [Candidatus Auribacterota bacterium]|jgi:hypothetical protein|nr:MvaI/BcnI family restriction endonuclease [Candidatus Auribacterota bacterium]
MEPFNISKEELIEKLKNIKAMGWIHTNRSKNDGAVGNTLEDLLQIPENNLAIANTVDWELKAQRRKTSSLITLFHEDPEPRKPESVVSKLLLPKYGWPHQQAGKKYPATEMSFRSTTQGNQYTNRGFSIKIDSVNRTINFVFNPENVDVSKHLTWYNNVLAHHVKGEKVLGYWHFDSIHKKCVGKIRNTIYVIADSRNTAGQEEFKYDTILLLEDFSFNNLLRGILDGIILVDFDARTNHNHGTKFRMKQNNWPYFYNKVTEVN